MIRKIIYGFMSIKIGFMSRKIIYGFISVLVVFYLICMYFSVSQRDLSVLSMLKNDLKNYIQINNGAWPKSENELVNFLKDTESPKRYKVLYDFNVDELKIDGSKVVRSDGSEVLLISPKKAPFWTASSCRAISLELYKKIIKIKGRKRDILLFWGNGNLFWCNRLFKK